MATRRAVSKTRKSEIVPAREIATVTVPRIGILQRAEELYQQIEEKHADNPSKVLSSLCQVARLEISVGRERSRKAKDLL